jgi:hypothetical protein
MEYRQGDIGLVRIAALPEGEGAAVKPVNGRLILAEGESTGHHHAIVADTLPALKWFGDVRVVVADEPFSLVHEEHEALHFEPGMYAVVERFEYDGAEERRVLD